MCWFDVKLIFHHVYAMSLQKVQKLIIIYDCGIAQFDAEVHRRDTKKTV